jgi:hypothetical protein
MPFPAADPATTLALTIIYHAVNAWKKNRALLDLLRLEPEIPVPHWLQGERESLLMFFHGEWFNFLFESATEEIDRGEMFKALGIPAQGGG